jgi:two-component system response regulator DevR
MNPLEIVLVDDHRIVRQGLRSILDPHPLFTVIGEASNGTEALELVANLKPNIVLLDLQLPDIAGVELCQRLVKIDPEPIILILTAFFNHELVNACLQAGARGYLLKDANKLNLEEQLLQVARGHSAMDPRAVDSLAATIRSFEAPSEMPNMREMAVLRLIAKGMTNKEIGYELHLSENTVKWYVKNILAKMGARNRTEAVLLAKERSYL